MVNLTSFLEAREPVYIYKMENCTGCLQPEFTEGKSRKRS